MQSNVDLIDPSNFALKYIKERIRSDDYRGSIGSQHNRWDFKELEIVLTELDRLCPNRSLMQIRNADLSKRPQNITGEEIYARFCNKINEKVGKGTQDSIRKNLFPDFARAGWIERFDSQQNKLDPYSKGSVKYVSLSVEGLKFLNSKSLDDRYFIFSKGVDNFLGGSINKIIHLISDPDFNLQSVDLLELTFFVSAVGSQSPEIALTLTECRDLILEWRKLSKYQKIGVDAHLTKELVKNPGLNSKLKQRDYHNWINSAQQGFSLLKQTIYFEEWKDPKNSHLNRIVWMQNGDQNSSYSVRLKRSLNQKHEYMKQHGVAKKQGFELHHVVALAWAESEYHFKLLDDWKNMVYIDAYSHAKITQNGNKNVMMKFDHEHMFLQDFSKHEVEFKPGKNLIWSESHKNTMSEYNRMLLDFVNTPA
jgi:hypothetical protein